ncbi:hypothetical protein NDN13_05075 [Acinetobacter sp. C32I]|uniref:hypothetical protein n=1 Tax=Acinetobacter sp. C32I TaxID=2950074 RepID=UPI0020376595|nr:hypothetical protein [Acinetobacter sp. C32I]USA54569.1 hypothetical protein NDN13_05075 [Acinetobacter sp. C32I]
MALDTFNVFFWQNSSWKNKGNILNKVDGLTLNKNKAYPLRLIARNGTTSPANNVFNAVILDIKLIGTLPDKYYKLSYFKNGNTSIVGALDGWVIEEFDKANYETANNASLRIVDYTHPVADVNKNGTIQTVKVVSAIRSEFQAFITLDTASLPPVGTPITSLNAGTSGWSWIIDPSCYGITIPSALVINQGKDFPNRVIQRNNVTSPFNSFIRDAILDVRITGARQGNYYGIRYFKNGSTEASGVMDGWIIEEQAIADYGTTETALAVVPLANPYTVALDRTKGIQTVVFDSIIVPSLRVYITVDPAKFPPFGEFVRMNSVSNAGYSHIIDPSKYTYQQPLIENALTINQGKNFPNKRIARNAETSNPNSFLLDVLLDVKVINARQGYYYGIRYFKNGTTLLPGAADGWIIEEQVAADYGTNSAATRIISYTDAAPDITRGGIQTIRLTSPRSDVELLITMDTDKLLPYGQYISMLNSGSAGYSWIIDPSRYEYSKPMPSGATSLTALSYTCTEAGRLRLIWQSGQYLYRLSFGPNGYNSLPNLISLDRAPFGDRNTAQWINVNSASTDWLPPLVVEAVNDGDGKSQIYTGGNHGADGSAGGGNTARNIHYQILADGQPMKMGEAFGGNAEKVSVQIVNELTAFNTTGTVDPENFPSRYVLSQSFAVDIYCGSMEISSEVKAYEQISVRTDNGPQTVSVGYQESMLYLDGQFATRVPFDNSTNSGIKTQYPKVWALILQHSVNGQFVAWMDREYEAGDGRYVSGNAPYIRGGFTTNTKFYHAAVAGGIRAELQMGEKYKWRGGYAWQAPTLQGTFDSTIVFHKNGKMTTAIVKTAIDYTVV